MRYTAIRSEGGLLPYDLLDEILAETAPGQKAPDFGLPKGRRVSDEIQRVWLDAQELWSRFKVGRDKLSDKDPHGTTLTRDRWIGPMLTDPVRLSYDLHFQSSALVLGGLTFAISHRAGEPNDSPPVHIEGCGIELDKRPQKYRVSPQAMVQEFLNRSESLLWGVVTNGLRFRLLRDSVRTARPTYLEFDLETILEGGHYNEFVLFYRLCHRTRLPQAGRPSEDCWLEKYYQLSVEKGGRVRDNLRDGVEEALKVLGTGFLRHPENTDLREKIDSGRLNVDQYHRQLLLLVYRLLFLTVAEDRHLVIPIGESAVRNQAIYQDNYSIGKLRERAEGLLEDSGFSDLWLGLTQTFNLFADSNDTNPLGIPPLNGDLFSQATIPDLETARLSNLDLLKAVRWLMFYRERNIRQRVNYAALDVEELGSVYESLLDFQPMVFKEPDGWKFDLGVGGERKTTGSYYTRPELVRELIQSALVPVLEDRLAQVEKQAKGQPAETIRDAKVKAIQEISVCDPACGSGHFLLEAARRLGKELARIRVGEDEPTPEQFHVAVRDVISHCIYGVDQNPLAVDLCKLALWLEGHWAGKPLSFLDHRIRCGNSLIGVLDPVVMVEGIPDDAFNPVTGDDKKVAAVYKKRNKAEKALGQKRLEFEQSPAEHSEEYAELFGVGLDFPEDKPSDVRKKAELFAKARSGVDWWHDYTAANLWTASFFVSLTRLDDPLVPTQDTFLSYFLHRQNRPQMTGAANSLAGELRFFHWRLEFPEVFERGGFDVLLGNPPWERPEFHEKLFWLSDPYISSARTDEEREERIEEYRTSSDPVRTKRIQNFDLAQHSLGSTSKFWKQSSRFPLTAAGKFNIFALFSELAVSLLVSTGRVGIIVPSGILTDDVCKIFFADVTRRRIVVSDLNIENRSGWFPDIDTRIQFCLLTLSMKGSNEATSFFYLDSPAEASDERRRLRLTSSDYALLNPNTLTSPLCRTERDLVLTEKLYTSNCVLLDEAKSLNQYSIKIRRILNMGSGPVKTKAQKAAKLLLNNFTLRPDKSFDNGTEVYLPILESKLFHQYDPRFATYDTLEDAGREAKARDSRDAELADPSFNVQPRNWFSKSAIDEIYRGNWNRQWILAFRDIARSTDERSMISAILPYCATDLTVRVIVSTRSTSELALLHANLNSLPLDYLLRQFLPSTHVSDYVSEQLAIIDLEKLLTQDRAWIIERVLKLSYVCDSLKAFARELGHEAPPFPWDPVQRHCLRTELDAYFAHLYGLTRNELMFILDPTEILGKDFPSETFRVLKEKDEREFKEFRTYRLVMSAFDALSQSERFKGEKRDCTISGRTWSVGD